MHTLIFDQYRRAASYKASLGTRGLYEQSRINERFYIGDQWYGARCGDEKPLVRYNVIKRIGDYKMAQIGGTPLAVSYSAAGVPVTAATQAQADARREMWRAGNAHNAPALPADAETALIMTALGDYHRATAERVGLDALKNTALRRAFITGTGILYTYWDPDIPTGQYADAARTTPIRGDIRCEVLDVENVYFGDPAVADVQAQPWIILAARRPVSAIVRDARRAGMSEDAIAAIKPDEGACDPDEPKATQLTKLYKEYAPDGSYRVMAVTAVAGTVVRPPFDIGIRLYPLAALRWETRGDGAYGESEVTHLIQNQIAINRAVTAGANAVMMMGMPIMVVNEDVVPVAVTNDPGQIIPVNGAEDLHNALHYVAPADFAPQFEGLVSSMISNTLTQSGANDAALGDVRPDNASAILALQDAARIPLKLLQHRFYAFMEEVARIWAEFWVCLYGRRTLRVCDAAGVWYFPFDAATVRDTVIRAQVDVGPAGMWSELQSRQTLDSLLEAGVLTPLQYLERLPHGTLPRQTELIRALRAERRETDAVQ